MIALIDCETTGLDPATSHVWQVGVIIVDKHWQYQSGIEVTILTPEIEKELEERRDVLPNLPPLEKIKELAVDEQMALRTLTGFTKDVTTVIAYNSKFDKAHISKLIESTGFSMTQGGHALLFAPWLCAMEDLRTNYQHKCWKLGHIALDYGIAVDPSMLHGAYGDIQLTRKILEKSGILFDEFLAFANSPWVVLRAVCDPPWVDGGVSTDRAKKSGFTWEKIKGADDVFPKSWVRRVKECQLNEFLNENKDMKIAKVKT